METHVVIGAGYGDEGKGLFTNYFSDSKTLNIRFNGGAQAGHTVEKNGHRHVFHHFGSGTFSGAHTFLDKHFVVSPELFIYEYASIKANVHQVYVHPDCLVTTPYDVLLNKFLENSRGGKRHGSCGVGFGETIERSQNPEFKLTFKDLSDSAKVKSTLEKIRDNYIGIRLEAFSATVNDLIISLLTTEKDLFQKFPETFLLPVQRMLAIIDLCEPYSQDFYKNYRKIVFEGAQGLMLDQDYGEFPHVTRSNTGLKNVVETLKEFGIKENIHIHYITRIYKTRHGAGPLKKECSSLPYIDFSDMTNSPNPYQGSIRLAPIDTEELSNAIKHDLRYISDEFDYSVSVGITCLDQFSGSSELRDKLVGKIAESVPRRNTDRYLVSHSSSGQHISFRFFPPDPKILETFVEAIRNVDV